MQGRTTRYRGALVVLLVALAGCGDKPTKTPSSSAQIWTRGDVEFGVLAPLAEARGRDLVDGATLAAEDLNIRGGVLGKQVKLVTRDDGCTAAASRTSARELASASVAGVLGGVCAGAARAAARTLGDGLPFLVTGASAPGIVSRSQTPTAYLTSGTRHQGALAAARFFILQRASRLAVVSDDSQASKTLAREVIGLASPTPKAVSRQTVSDPAPDWAQLAATTLAAKPDTVYFAGAGDASGAYLAALKAAGFDGRFVASAQSESGAFLNAAGAAAEGAFVVAPASPQNLPEAADWAARFEKRFKRPPGRDAMRAYDALRALAQAVTQTGKVDAKANSAELPRLAEDYGGFLGGLRFAADHTVLYDDNIALRVSGGAFTLADALRSYSEG